MQSEIENIESVAVENEDCGSEIVKQEEEEKLYDDLQIIAKKDMY